MISSIQRHPSGLFLIAASNMWERFGFYMMRSILVLYMAKILVLSTQQAYGIFATFCALLYLTPQIGGHIADQYLGKRQALLLGGLLLSVGYFLLALPSEKFFYFALATIIIGSGFFVPNISSLLGELYQENDARREGGFSILYSAINVGALLPPLISASLIAFFGWKAAFTVAGLGVLFGTAILYFGFKKYFLHSVNIKLTKPIQFYLTLFVSLAFGIVTFAFLVKHAPLANFILFSVSSCLIFYIIKSSYTFPKRERQRVIVGLILAAFSIIFWALFAQGGMSLTLYAEYHVNRKIAFGTIPTMMFLALSPLYIIVFGPLFSKIWIELAKRNQNPSIPTKFAIGTILMGLGFAIMPIALLTQSENHQISFFWIVITYLLQSLGELFISPVGLSMMTSLSPKKMVGLMIGIWYFAMALANAFGGLISSLTTTQDDFSSPSTHSIFVYSHIFGFLGWSAIISGVLILLFVPYLKKMINPQLNNEELSLREKEQMIVI